MATFVPISPAIRTSRVRGNRMLKHSRILVAKGWHHKTCLGAVIVFIYQKEIGVLVQFNLNFCEKLPLKLTIGCPCLKFIAFPQKTAGQHVTYLSDTSCHKDRNLIIKTPTFSRKDHHFPVKIDHPSGPGAIPLQWNAPTYFTSREDRSSKLPGSRSLVLVLRTSGSDS